MNSKAIIVGLCGRSGNGKTKTCQLLVKELRAGKIQCTGFISPAVFEGSKKIAIQIRWLDSDQERVLMTPATETSQLIIGKWQLNSEAFDWINQKLTELRGGKVFFCDEIGPLEVLEGKGWIKALDVVDEGKYELNVITFRPSLREYFQRRYPEITIIDLDKNTHEQNLFKEVRNFFGIN